MKKVLTGFLAVSLVAIGWLVLDLARRDNALPGNGPFESQVDWTRLSQVLPGRFVAGDGRVSWHGILRGQRLGAGDASLDSSHTSAQRVRANATFAGPQLLGTLALVLPAKATGPINELETRLNLSPKPALPVTPWLAATGNIGLDVDSAGKDFALVLNARDVALQLALPTGDRPIGTTSFDSLSAAARLESNVLAIEQVVATTRGLRVSGEGQITAAADYESSTIALNLRVTRSKLAHQPQLDEAFAAFAVPGTYHLTLVGSLAAPQVMVNGVPIEAGAVPHALPAAGSPASRQAMQRPDTAHEPRRTEARYSTSGGAPGRARGRAPVPWPGDSEQARRFEQLWAPLEKEFRQLADEGQTVRGLTRKALKRQVIDQVKAEFGERLEE